MTTQPMKASITSAVELHASEKKEIESLILTMTNSESVAAEYSVDPAVLGGLRVEAGDWMLDTTIQHQLMKLTHQLMKRS